MTTIEATSAIGALIAPSAGWTTEKLIVLSLLQRNGVRTTLTDANCNTIIAALRVAAEVYDHEATVSRDDSVIQREFTAMAAETRSLAEQIEDGW